MFQLFSTEVRMQFFRTVLMALALIVSGFSNPVFAEDKDPLFIALSSDATRRVGHVLHFAELQRARGHPLTIWLNESGILLASRKYTEKHANHQAALAELMSKGATILICHYYPGGLAHTTVGTNSKRGIWARRPIGLPHIAYCSEPDKIITCPADQSLAGAHA
ncbi:MAG: hypothetical protein DVS81_20130 [Candidatus Accumulibacter meliphilus]|uniref:DsrE/DsrF-like family protein n=1 Tax=Candidatus Accumulibacter meliphilus TaxID=2211374 RepID=A0A369XG04_9PROT|nr:MAG: hypothetical protein DVS81_20130 [Candidatus Accumulibacter meliphilus]